MDTKKFRFYMLVLTRAYLPLVAVTFLSLPNTDLSQISVFITAWLIAKFLFEIPSWYLWDRIWHKKTLILSQLFLWIWAVLFWISTEIYGYVIASVMMALGQSLASWTAEAYFHESLEDQWKEKDFAKLWSQLKWSTWVASIIFLIGYPMLAEINATRPFLLAGFMNFTWMIIATTFKEPDIHHNIQESHRSIKEVIRKQWWTGTFFIILVFGLMSSTYLAEFNFRQPFIVEQWAWLIWIWIMMGISRLLMRIFSHSIVKAIYKYPLKKVMLISLCTLSAWYALVSFSSNFYISVLIISAYIWYRQSTRGITSKFLINTLKDNRYKATILSLYGQTQDILSAILVIWIWYLMDINFNTGYLITSVILFVVMLAIILIYAPNEKLE